MGIVQFIGEVVIVGLIAVFFLYVGIRSGLIWIAIGVPLVAWTLFGIAALILLQPELALSSASGWS